MQTLESEAKIIHSILKIDASYLEQIGRIIIEMYVNTDKRQMFKFVENIELLATGDVKFNNHIQTELPAEVYFRRK